MEEIGSTYEELEPKAAQYVVRIYYGDAEEIEDVAANDFGSAYWMFQGIALGHENIIGKEIVDRNTNSVRASKYISYADYVNLHAQVQEVEG